jgi:hypothetical protein
LLGKLHHTALPKALSALRFVWSLLTAPPGCHHAPVEPQQPAPTSLPKVMNPYQAAGALVIAKCTSKNQLTLPKVVVEQVGNADYYDV